METKPYLYTHLKIIKDFLQNNNKTFKQTGKHLPLSISKFKTSRLQVAIGFFLLFLLIVECISWAPDVDWPGCHRQFQAINYSKERVNGGVNNHTIRMARNWGEPNGPSSDLGQIIDLLSLMKSWPSKMQSCSQFAESVKRPATTQRQQSITREAALS